MWHKRANTIWILHTSKFISPWRDNYNCITGFRVEHPKPESNKSVEMQKKQYGLGLKRSAMSGTRAAAASPIQTVGAWVHTCLTIFRRGFPCPLSRHLRHHYAVCLSTAKAHTQLNWTADSACLWMIHVLLGYQEYLKTLKYVSV